MVPLLALGLPGGGFTAIMIGVLTLHDLTPGPLVMIQHKALVWVLFCGMFWASIAILVLGLIETRMIVNLLRIPFSILGPAIIFFSTIGAFSLRNNILDVWTIFVAGILGYVLRRYGYSLPAIVMGVILGQIGEEAFYQSMVLMGLPAARLLRLSHRRGVSAPRGRHDRSASDPDRPPQSRSYRPIT